MKKCFVLLIVLLSSVFCFADDINMVGDPPHEQGGNGNRGQTLLPTVDYTDGEVTIFVPYQIDDMAVTIRDNQGEVLYSTVIPVILVQHSIVLPDNVDANKFSIQIAYSDIHLIGWF
jgi:hypothetical protein